MNMDLLNKNYLNHFSLNEMFSLALGTYIILINNYSSFVDRLHNNFPYIY